MVHLNVNFRWEWTSRTNLCWYHETRLITLSCSIKISAVCYFVSLQSTCVSDGRTDKRTNYDPHDRASIAASRGKNVTILLCMASAVANPAMANAARREKPMSPIKRPVDSKTPRGPAPAMNPLCHPYCEPSLVAGGRHLYL